MPRTTQQTKAHIDQLTAAYEERIEIARIAQVTLGVEMAAAEDQTPFANQIASHQRDIDVLTSAIAALSGVARDGDLVSKAEAACRDAVSFIELAQAATDAEQAEPVDSAVAGRLDADQGTNKVPAALAE